MGTVITSFLCNHCLIVFIQVCALWSGVIPHFNLWLDELLRFQPSHYKPWFLCLFSQPEKAQRPQSAKSQGLFCLVSNKHETKAPLFGVQIKWLRFTDVPRALILWGCSCWTLNSGHSPLAGLFHAHPPSLHPCNVPGVRQHPPGCGDMPACFTFHTLSPKQDTLLVPWG